MTTDENIMALAHKYAASNGRALLEKLYGTSQSHTEQCAAGALKDRQELRTAIEALVAERDAKDALLRQALDGIEQHLRHHERGCVFLDEIAFTLRQRLGDSA